MSRTVRSLPTTVLVETDAAENTTEGFRDTLDESLIVEKVYRQCGSGVYALAKRMLGNEADAEDVAQEVLLQVVRNLDTFQGKSTIMTWLYRITVNAALALRRKRASIRERHHADTAESGYGDVYAAASSHSPAPDAELLDSELRERIETAITRLPEVYRVAFILNDVEHLSYLEISEVLCISLAAVKTRIHRARLMMRGFLRTYLEERCAVA